MVSVSIMEGTMAAMVSGFKSVVIINQETKLVHSKYEIFCADNGFQYMGLASFSKEITRQIGCSVKDKRVNGKKARVFVE